MNFSTASGTAIGFIGGPANTLTASHLVVQAAPTAEVRSLTSTPSTMTTITENPQSHFSAVVKSTHIIDAVLPRNPLLILYQWVTAFRHLSNLSNASLRLCPSALAPGSQRRTPDARADCDYDLTLELSQLLMRRA
jgi:hypothetical protein